MWLSLLHHVNTSGNSDTLRQMKTSGKQDSHCEAFLACRAEDPDLDIDNLSRLPVSPKICCDNAMTRIFLN